MLPGTETCGSLKRQNRTALDVPCKRQHSFVSHIKRPPYLAPGVKTLALAEALMTTCQKWMRHPPPDSSPEKKSYTAMVQATTPQINGSETNQFIYRVYPMHLRASPSPRRSARAAWVIAISALAVRCAPERRAHPSAPTASAAPSAHPAETTSHPRPHVTMATTCNMTRMGQRLKHTRQ